MTLILILIIVALLFVIVWAAYRYQLLNYRLEEAEEALSIADNDLYYVTEELKQSRRTVSNLSESVEMLVVELDRDPNPVTKIVEAFRKMNVAMEKLPDIPQLAEERRPRKESGGSLRGYW